LVEIIPTIDQKKVLKCYIKGNKNVTLLELCSSGIKHGIDSNIICKVARKFSIDTRTNLFEILDLLGAKKFRKIIKIIEMEIICENFVEIVKRIQKSKKSVYALIEHL